MRKAFLTILASISIFNANKISIVDEINMQNDQITVQLKAIPEILKNDKLLIFNKIKRIDVIKNEVENMENKIENLLDKINIKDNQKIFNKRWGILSERILNFHKIGLDALADDTITTFDSETIFEKMKEFIKFYNEIFDRNRDYDPQKLTKQDISNYRYDYTSIKNLKIKSYNSLSLQKILLAHNEIDYKLKCVIEDPKTILTFNSKEPVNDKIDYNIHIEVNANGSTYYTGKLNIILRITDPIKVIDKLSESVMSLGIDRLGNWYAGGENIIVTRPQPFHFGAAGQASKKIDNLYGQATSIAVDNSGNWYAGTFQGALYFGKSGQAGKKIAILDPIVESLAVDNYGNWYAGTTNGNLYYGESGKAGKKIATLDTEITYLSVDSNNNWYAGTRDGTLYFGKSGQKGKIIPSLEGQGVSFALNKDGSWYAGTWTGLLYYAKPGQKPEKFAKIPNRDWILSLAVDGSGNWYAGSRNGLLYYGKPGQTGKVIAKLDGQIKKLLVNSNGNWYAGTNTGSVYFG